MAKRISVVVSQGQSQNPAKRNLEESIVTALMMESGVDVTVIPHLYDLKPDGTGMLALKSLSGNMVVLSWLFERASHWLLDRNGVHGRVGEVELTNESDDDEEDEELKSEIEEDEKERVIDSRTIPNRNIYCLDLRVRNKAEDYVAEILRIQKECSVKVVPIGLGGGSPSNGSPTNGATTNGAATNGAATNGADTNGADTNGAKSNGSGQAPTGQPTQAQLDRMANPTNDTALALDGNGTLEGGVEGSAPAILNRIEEEAARRWYPVIDYSRCTNCMECIDFCLFGVYGVDQVDSILVEQPDNCRKGCPACSRVCPENAIMFPQHKTPAIAGSDEVGGSLKIDLSKLFGAPEDGKSAEEIAAIERDEQLIAAGREAVGMAMPKRQAGKADEPKDDLDSLVDELDELDL